MSMPREAIPIMKTPSPWDFPCLVVMVLENFPQVLGTVFSPRSTATSGIVSRCSRQGIDLILCLFVLFILNGSGGMGP